MKIHAELPEQVGQAALLDFCPDNRFGYQIKFNGEYRTIMKDSAGIHDFNRDGGRGKGLPPALVAALLRHPLPKFIIAGELIPAKKMFHLFDALILGDKMLGPESYNTREKAYHKHFDNFAPMILPVDTARGHEAKAALAIMALEQDCEGIIIRYLEGAYVEGRSGQHKKVKFWKMMDAVVLGPCPKGHHSVRLGCYNAQGKLQEICGAKILDFHPKKGDVVEVKYNKGTRRLHIMEIHMERIRFDKKPRECTLDQIKVNRDFKI